MHKIFITDGIVLSKRGVGEANSLVTLLTAELGLLRASARSARYEKSKLRYGLEPLTHGRFSLVRGKFEWKLTGVVDPQKLFSIQSVSTAGEPSSAGRPHSSWGRQAVGRVTRLMLRLIQGEEPVPVLYETVKSGFEFLADSKNENDVQAIECVLVLRMLAQLGYLPERPELAPFVATSAPDELFSLELTAQAASSRTLLIKAINESLTATGL